MKNIVKDGIITENGAGVGTVTKAMVRARAVELAAINGRSESEVTRPIGTRPYGN